MSTKIAVVLLVLVSTAFFAVAQVHNPVVAAVPFPFYVGSKLLPAGSYKIQTTGDMVTVADDNGKDSALAQVITRISSSTEDQDSVVFDVAGNDHYLSEIYIQGEDGYLIKSSAEKHTHIRIKGKK